MNIKKIALFALMASTPMSSFASTITGPYVSGGAGYTLTQTQHGIFSPNSFADGTGSSGAGSARFRHHNGFNGYGSFGWGFGNGLRTEIEGTYFQSQYNQLSHTAGVGKTRGVDQNYGALVNVIYDIDLKKHFGIDSPITPYVGVGAGYLWSGMNGVNTAFDSGQHTRWSGTRGSFAYQGIVGASYDIKSVPGLALTADYRMIGQTFYNGAYNSGTSGAGGFHSGNVNYDPRFNHQFNVGVRYAFDPAPPPPATVSPVSDVPAVVPARTYLVFFDWDSSVLSSRAKQIVIQAVGASSHVQTTKIEVNGYSDNSSIHGGERGAKYNMKLSLERADAVKAELVKDGIPLQSIDIHGYGEKNPLIATGPNTREPQNRRVEIILR